MFLIFTAEGPRHGPQVACGCCAVSDMLNDFRGASSRRWEPGAGQVSSEANRKPWLEGQELPRRTVKFSLYRNFINCRNLKRAAVL